MFDNFEYFGNFDDDLIDDDHNDGDDHDDDTNMQVNFLSSNNDINVENCLCPKWLLCASVIDKFKKILFSTQKKIKYFFFFFEKMIFG